MQEGKVLPNQLSALIAVKEDTTQGSVGWVKEKGFSVAMVAPEIWRVAGDKVRPVMCRGIPPRQCNPTEKLFVAIIAKSWVIAGTSVPYWRIILR